MNATKVAKRKLGYNQYVKPEKFRLLLAIIVSKNWISVFVYVANRLCLCDLKTKANLNSGQQKGNKKWGYSNETTALE